MTLQPAQFQQLQMFMKPSEVSAMPGFRFGDSRTSGFGEERDTEDLRTLKLYEADGGSFRRGGVGLATQIEEEGVKDPIALAHIDRNPVTGREHSTRLANGHHRYFVQERREREGEEVYLPVAHY